jgi:hypothetical protein
MFHSYSTVQLVLHFIDTTPHLKSTYTNSAQIKGADTKFCMVVPNIFRLTKFYMVVPNIFRATTSCMVVSKYFFGG